jgi:hypothetical protein
MHDYRSIPIGTATAINVTRDGIRARWRWLAGDEFADRVKNAWEQGVIRAASIGFKPLESVRNEEGGYDHLRWELLEFSLVTIGANQDAVRQLKGLGLADSLHDRLSSEITDGIMHHLRHAFDKTIEIEDRDLVDVPLATVDRMIARAMASGLADAVGSAVQRRLDYLRGRVHPEDCRPAQVWGN